MTLGPTLPDSTAPNPIEPARAIAAIVQDELHITVDPEALIAMFKKRWRSLNVLAHTLHNSLQDRTY